MGHEVVIYEPADAWSLKSLVAAHGEKPVHDFHEKFPQLDSTRYHLDTLDLDAMLDGVDLGIVHERNHPSLVAQIGAYRATHQGFTLFFHDTHHRMATAPEQMRRYDLSHYDGVLANGRALRDLYISRDWAGHAWTWHQAADTRVFRPHPSDAEKEDVVWIGNWAEGERAQELSEYLLNPIRDLALSASVFGNGYPPETLAMLAHGEIAYRGWLPNFRVPETLARYRVAIHVPHRLHARALPGIPSLRIFEALACGIPLICAPWADTEELFTEGKDFLVARNGFEMQRQLWALLNDAEMANELTLHGLKTIYARHSCKHRAKELLDIHAQFARPALALSR